MAVLHANDLLASCLQGALPPVDLQAVCLVQAIWGYKSVSVEDAAAVLNLVPGGLPIGLKGSK